MKPHNKLPEPQINQFFNDWKVIRISSWNGIDSRSGKKLIKVFYQAIHPCGNTRKFSASQLWKKDFSPCKKCQSREIYRKNAKEIILNEMFRQYKYAAKKRNYEFLIDKKLFNELVLSKCFYCGTEPTQKRMVTEKRRSIWNEKEYILTNGIDRVNNSKGYEIDNCVPCCQFCNISKHTLSISEWKEKIIQLYERKDLF